MKVRRKSEIELLRELLEEMFASMEKNLTQLEAERTTPTDALAASGRTRLKYWREKAEAAHYEPVPEPWEPRVNFRGNIGTRDSASICCLKNNPCVNHAAPSVSEEQPAVFGTPDIISRTVGSKADDFLRKVDAHRATIALIPCRIHPDKFLVTKDGKYCLKTTSRTSDFWCGTEAEAKAKLESLRGQK